MEFKVVIILVFELSRLKYHYSTEGMFAPLASTQTQTMKRRESGLQAQDGANATVVIVLSADVWAADLSAAAVAAEYLVSGVWVKATATAGQSGTSCFDTAGRNTLFLLICSLLWHTFSLSVMSGRRNEKHEKRLCVLQFFSAVFIDLFFIFLLVEVCSCHI